jgi:hypothetical protein
MEDTDATQLMLEALFDVRGMVSDLHSLYFEKEDPDDGEEEEEDA